MAEKQKKTPFWLKRTQENSWEAEILLSGLVLFALMQVPNLLEELSHLINIKVVHKYYFIIPLEFFKIAIQVLISGFIIHLIFRGIWIGLVGLSFVFPEGSNISKLKFSKKYNKRLEKKLTSPTNSILKIEKLCSLIFSTSFLLFGYVIGFMIYLSTLILLVVSMNFSPIFGIIIFIYLLLSVLYFIDFITGGFIKRIKWLSPVYYPIYRYFSFITLSFLYRNVYYTIITNIKKWKIYMGAIIYIIAFSLITTLIDIKNNKTNTQSKLLTTFIAKNRKVTASYENLKENQKIGKASIQSDVIEDNFLRLFLVHHASNDDRIVKSGNINKSSDMSIDELNNCFNRLYKVQIDDSLYKKVYWNSYVHPQTNEPGIITLINIEELKFGWHKLYIYILKESQSEKKEHSLIISSMEGIDYNEDQKPPIDSTEYYSKIPFYKVRKGH